MDRGSSGYPSLDAMSRTAMNSRPGNLILKVPVKTPGWRSIVIFHVSMTSTSQWLSGGVVMSRYRGRPKPKYAIR